MSPPTSGRMHIPLLFRNNYVCLTPVLKEVEVLKVLTVLFLPGRQWHLGAGETCPSNCHPSGWLRASAFTCRLISLVGVKRLCLQIGKQALPPSRVQAAKGILAGGGGGLHWPIALRIARYLTLT